MKHIMQNQPKQNRGFSLIEMLVAVLVVSVGLLGIAGLQVYSLKNNQVAYTRSQATIKAYDIVDRMRANRAAAMNGNYNITLATDSASGGTLAADDLNDWLQDLATSMSNGDGAVAVNTATGVVTVTVQWLDDREAETQAEALQTFQITSQL